MQNRNLFSKIGEMFGSRKFWITLLVIALAAALFFYGQIDGPAFAAVVTIASAFYVGSLGLEDAARQLYPILGPVVKEILERRGGGSSTGA